MLHLVRPEVEAEENDRLVGKPRLGRVDEIVAEDQRLAEPVLIFADAAVELLVEQPEPAAVFRQRGQQREGFVARAAPVDVEIRLRAAASNDQKGVVQPD